MAYQILLQFNNATNARSFALQNNGQVVEVPSGIITPPPPPTFTFGQPAPGVNPGNSYVVITSPTSAGPTGFKTIYIKDLNTDQIIYYDKNVVDPSTITINPLPPSPPTPFPYPVDPSLFPPMVDNPDLRTLLRRVSQQVDPLSPQLNDPNLLQPQLPGIETPTTPYELNYNPYLLTPQPLQNVPPPDATPFLPPSTPLPSDPRIIPTQLPFTDIIPVADVPSDPNVMRQPPTIAPPMDRFTPDIFDPRTYNPSFDPNAPLTPSFDPSLPAQQIQPGPTSSFLNPRIDPRMPKKLVEPPNPFDPLIERLPRQKPRVTPISDSAEGGGTSGFGPGIFVMALAAGSGTPAAVWFSLNAVKWLQAKTPADGLASLSISSHSGGVNYENGLWVFEFNWLYDGVNSADAVVYSYDGQNWNLGFLPTAAQIANGQVFMGQFFSSSTPSVPNGCLLSNSAFVTPAKLITLLLPDINPSKPTAGSIQFGDTIQATSPGTILVDASQIAGVLPASSSYALNPLPSGITAVRCRAVSGNEVAVDYTVTAITSTVANSGNGMQSATWVTGFDQLGSSGIGTGNSSLFYSRPSLGINT